MKKVNLAKVRSAIAAMLAPSSRSPGRASAATDPAAPDAKRRRRRRCDRRAAVRDLGRADRRGPRDGARGDERRAGVVPVAQTFLDISQGNRVNQNLYDGDLPRLYVRDGRVPERLWDGVVKPRRQRPGEHRPRPAGLDPGRRRGRRDRRGRQRPRHPDRRRSRTARSGGERVPGWLRSRAQRGADPGRRAGRAGRGPRPGRPADRDRRRCAGRSGAAADGNRRRRV